VASVKKKSEVLSPAKIKIDGRAVCVSVSDDFVTVTLRDGRVISQPTSWTRELVGATPAQRQNYKLLGSGTAIYWPDVDADVCVSLMLFPRGSTGCTCGDAAR
jgi:hypothetical protein